MDSLLNFMKEVFPLNADLLIGISTAILVVITGFYAWQTKRVVDSTEKASIFQFLPHIKPSLYEIGPTSIIVRIMNGGKGPANQLEITLVVKEKPSLQRHWNQLSLVPLEFRTLIIPKDESESELDIRYFMNNQTTIEIM